MLINMDPLNHTRYRRLITRSFAARAVADLEPHVRTLCTAVDNIIDRGQCEFVRDVASQVPMQSSSCCSGFRNRTGRIFAS